MHFKQYLLNLLEQIDIQYKDYILVYLGKDIKDIVLISSLRLRTSIYLINPDDQFLRNAFLYYSVKVLYLDLKCDREDSKMKLILYNFIYIGMNLKKSISQIEIEKLF
jgi:hypothetical protein